METLESFDNRFRTEDDCRRYLMQQRWPDGVRCPRCGNEKVYTLKARPFNWLCKSGTESVNTETGEVVTCGKQNGYRFSVITGTVYENTKRPLKTWFKIGFLMLVSKKGVSALQLHRMMYGSKHLNNYYTTWYQCMRVRAAMKDSEWGKLMGEVEVDETYIGGDDRNRHWNKKSAQVRKRLGPQTPTGRAGDKYGYGKVGVVGAMARKGSVVCKVIGEAGAETLSGFVRETVSDKVTLLATDEKIDYNFVDPRMKHRAVKHSKGEYVRGSVHTQNIESFWSLLKRGVIGTFHNVSKPYLPLYLAEFTFRHNRRNDIDPFAELISNA